MINNIGLPGLLFLLVIALIWVIPMWRLLPKFGMSKWLSLLAFIPALGGIAMIVFIWIMAFKDPKPVGNPEIFS